MAVSSKTNGNKYTSVKTFDFLSSFRRFHDTILTFVEWLILHIFFAGVSENRHNMSKNQTYKKAIVMDLPVTYIWLADMAHKLREIAFIVIV